MSEERAVCEALPPIRYGTESDDLNRALWVAAIASLTGFLRTARKLLGMKHGEKCPKCGWTY